MITLVRGCVLKERSTPVVIASCEPCGLSALLHVGDGSNLIADFDDVALQDLAFLVDGRHR